jgi:hypothetical protein
MLVEEARVSASWRSQSRHGRRDRRARSAGERDGIESFPNWLSARLGAGRRRGPSLAISSISMTGNGQLAGYAAHIERMGAGRRLQPDRRTGQQGAGEIAGLGTVAAAPGTGVVEAGYATDLSDALARLLAAASLPSSPAACRSASAIARSSRGRRVLAHPHAWCRACSSPCPPAGR